ADNSLGPERIAYGPTAAGRRALTAALARPDWALQRPPPPFLTWLALSTHVSSAIAKRQVERRRDFLREQIARERATLAAIRKDTGEMVRVGSLMVDLTIRQFESELQWLAAVDRELDREGRQSRQ